MEFTVSENNKIEHYVQNWPVMKTSFGAATVILIYFILVLKILPSIMYKRKPLELKWLLLIVNIFQVFISLYVAISYAGYIWRHGFFSTSCPHKTKVGMDEMAVYAFPYFLSKHLDLFDTVLISLRKRHMQMTFLHLFHHSIMIVWAWLYYMCLLTDHFIVVCMLNSVVHVIMYFYYGLTVFAPRYAWWKKYVTEIQLLQFVVDIFVLSYQQYQTPCPMPLFTHWFAVFTVVAFFGLFMDFYIRKYGNKFQKGI